MEIIEVSRRVNSTRYRMLPPDFREYLTRGPRAALRHFLKTLTDGLFHVSARGQIQQPLIGLGILDHRFGFTLYGQHYGTVALLELFHQLCGIAPETGQGVNILGDIEHGLFDLSTLLGASTVV
jgi:hypothetical protein